MMGMNGAALATLLSQATYFVLAVVTVRLTLGNRILTRRHLLTIVLLVLLFAVNELCLRLMPTVNIWLSSLSRSLLLVLTAWLAYRWELSPELNKQIAQWLNK